MLGGDGAPQLAQAALIEAVGKTAQPCHVSGLAAHLQALSLRRAKDSSARLSTISSGGRLT